MKIDFVITTCGNQKLPYAAPAGVMYCGGFVKGQRRAAVALGGTALVLSSKYGLMSAETIVPGPYNSRWGQPGAVTDREIAAQANHLGIRPGHVVVCLGGVEYATRVVRNTSDGVVVYYPAKHLSHRGMGYQGQLHVNLKMLRRLPAICESKCRIK